MSDRIQKIYGVPGKPADALCEDDIDFSILAVGKHALKLRPFFCACSGDPFVRVNANILPFRIILNPFTVAADLCGQGMMEPFGLHRNSGISGDFLTSR